MKGSSNKVRDLFLDSIEVKKMLVEDQRLNTICDIGDKIIQAILNGNKLMLCGNGGSAADAQHLAAELLVRLRPKVNRAALPAIALSLDISTITACGNDFGYDCLYERMVQALGKKGDVLLGITTSGNSENVNAALLMARSMGVLPVGFLGGLGGKALNLCEHYFLVPSENTGRIQESHITAGHALMEYIEDELLERGYLEVQ